MPKALSEHETEAFRERICDCAARLYVEEGPAAVTMRRIATDLGCGTMTPYRYYPNKESIMTAVRTRGMHRFSQVLEDALGSPGDGRTRSRAVRDAYIAFARANTATYRLMFEYPEPHKDDTAYREAHERMLRTVVAHVDVMIDEGRIQADAPIFGHQIWAALHGAVMLEIAGMLPPGFDAASLHTRTVTALIDSARPPAP
ncbi:TetR/AcrR family transcriptional regulator [Dyella sp. GSA-30]|uniref:TetR/AcrR family transcriptional regulator n=1 Tax=Dyella sp. GSA-30 TaxID=2994496 RepID=UPI0024904A32|nr:TetR/AcrR family transcriptional regulator [Dyella sp. GSA-30]BDU20303.1 TetR family transcriptional regulator [Dyella sp. GSA-30]